MSDLAQTAGCGDCPENLRSARGHVDAEPPLLLRCLERKFNRPAFYLRLSWKYSQIEHKRLFTTAVAASLRSAHLAV